MNLKKLQNKQAESGQVLLIIVMLLATILTIVMTTSLSTATQTQLTKDQEDSVKARAAAESALELALSEAVGTNKTFDQYIQQNPQLAEIFSGINTAESYIQVSGENTRQFVSPVIESSSQYTFYLTNYSEGTLGGSTTNQATFPSTGTTLKVYYGNNSGADCSNMVVEFTIISGNKPYTLTKYIAGSEAKLGSGDSTIGQSLTTPKKLEGNDTTFYCVATVPTPFPDNLKLLLVRPMVSSTRLGFESTGANLISQGKTVKAVAKSNTGITRTVQLFQSYPQLPANMFVTSF